MNTNEFNKAFYESRETATSRAARRVLVDGIGVNLAARCEYVDKASVSKMVTRIKKQAP